MKELLYFVAGLFMSLIWWLFTPYQKVDFYIPAFAISCLIVLSAYIFILKEKINCIEGNMALTSKAVNVRENLLIFKVSISEVFCVDGIVTVFRENGQFEEAIAVGIVENIQKNKLVQVRVFRFIEDKSINDLNIINVLFIKPSINITWLEGAYRYGKG